MPIMPSNAPWKFIALGIVAGIGVILFCIYLVFTLLA